MLISIGDEKLYSGLDLETWDQDLDTWTGDIEDWAAFDGNTELSSQAIHHAIEERSTAEFIIIDELGKDRPIPWHFEFGQNVLIRSMQGDLLFSGIVDSSQETRDGGFSSIIRHSIACADEHYRADKRIVKGIWQDTSLGSQVLDILHTFFAEEGIIEGEIQEGSIPPLAISNYVRGNEAMDTRTQYMASYTWFISEERKLYFIDRSTYLCPWRLTSDDCLGTPTVERSAPKYRNKQFIRGAQAETDPQTESKIGDGTNRTFIVGYPIGREPTIEVNDVAKTVGIKGVETGFDWYWSKNDNTITQDSGGSALTTEDVLDITYVGLYPIMVAVSSPGEIGTEQELEGLGTGMVEDIIDDSTISSKDDAIDLAGATLSHYARRGRKLQFRTLRDDGIAAGQLLAAYLPHHGVGIDGYYLLEDGYIQLALEAELTEGIYLIQSLDILEDEGIIYRDITAVEGPIDGSWESFFCNLTKKSTDAIYENIQEGSSLVGLYEFSKTWAELDSPNVFGEVYPSASLFADDDWPCFADDDKQKYLVLLDADGNELFRKFRTRQVLTSGKISTTIFVSGPEAVGDIAKVCLYGGNACGSGSGSGTKLSEWDFVYSKSEFEALQIECTDNKGW